MLQQPTSKEHKRFRQGPTIPNTAEIHLKCVTKYGGRIPCGIQNRNHSKKGPSGMVLMKLLRGKLVAMEITC